MITGRFKKGALFATIVLCLAATVYLGQPYSSSLSDMVKPATQAPDGTPEVAPASSGIKDETLEKLAKLEQELKLEKQEKEKLKDTFEKAKKKLIADAKKELEDAKHNNNFGGELLGGEDDADKPWNLDPAHKVVYPEVSPDMGVNDFLQKMGIRRMDQREIHEPPTHDVKYNNKIDVNSYVGNMLHDDWIADRPDKLICGETMYAPNGRDELLEASDSVAFKDPRVQDDLKAFLYQTGLKLFASYRDMAHWYRFSGSATWIPQESAYLMVSRLFYSTDGRKKVILSLNRLQLFDKNWNEIYDRRIRFVDVDDGDIDKAMRKYVKAESDLEREAALDRISLHLPGFTHYEMPVNEGKEVMGPEDPKIALRPDSTGGEPIILFNMRVNEDKRQMFVSFPLRKRQEGYTQTKHLLFEINGEESKTEKNWTPFFQDDDGNADGLGSMHILYSYDPLIVAKCDLDRGECEVKQKDERDDDMPNRWQVHDRAFIRGATNLVKFPESMMAKIRPDGTDLKLWMGFAKTHVERCGCGPSFYRPVLVAIANMNGRWTLALISENMDLGHNVMSWNHKDTNCGTEGPNVFSPNSIAQWNVNKDGMDELDLTMSEADAVDMRITVRGVGHYLTEIFQAKNFRRDKISYAEQRGRMLSNCLVNSAYDYCIVYGRHHLPP